MDTLINLLIWVAITAAMTGLVWLYGASWRAAAKALSEAMHQSTHDATTPSTVPTPTAPLSSHATAGRDNMHVGAIP